MSFSSTQQHGQALPIGLALIMMGALASLVLFNTGKLATEKSNVANTADAAVYSGLVWQARTLNFQAYTNRAMVANQVSIAQLVSLGSWTNYGRISARNLDYAIGWIPVVKPFTSAALNVMTQLENIIQNGVKVAIPIINGVNEVLSIAQEAVYNASYVVTPEVVSQVVNANDSRYSASSVYAIAAQARNAASWHNFSERHSGSAQPMQRKVSVIEASRDEFSKDRSWDTIKPLPSRIYVTPIDRFTIVKEGTTKLVHDGDSWEWRGKDSLSVHWEHYSCWSCKWRSAEIPMGWGQNFAYSDSDCPGGDCTGWMQRNAFGEELADLEGESLGDVYSGVKSYRSLKDLTSRNRDARITLHVEVEVANNDIRSAEKIRKLGSPAPPDGELITGMESGLFYTNDKYAGDSMASMSSAEVFFERPVLEEGDQLIVADVGAVNEYANLFNPYWDVRLIEVSETERQLAWLSRDSALSRQIIGRFAQAAAVAGLVDQTSELQSLLGSDQFGAATDYASLGSHAVRNLQSGMLENAVKDQALGALKNIASSALSSYASSNGFGSIADLASESLGSDESNETGDANDGGETSESSLTEAAINAAGNREGSQLGEAITLGQGLLAGAGELSDIIVLQANSADYADRLSQQIEGLDTDIGDNLKAILEDQFSEEISLKDQLLSLGSSLGGAGENFEQQINGISADLRASAETGIDERLSIIEQEFQATYGEELNIDREEILESFAGSFDEIAASLVGESSELIQATMSGVQDAIAERFSGLQITPDSVADGVLQSASEFVGEQQASAAQELETALNEAGELIVEVTEEQLQEAVEEVETIVDEKIDEYHGAPEERLWGLPSYEP